MKHEVNLFECFISIFLKKARSKSLTNPKQVSFLYCTKRLNKVYIIITTGWLSIIWHEQTANSGYSAIKTETQTVPPENSDAPTRAISNSALKFMPENWWNRNIDSQPVSCWLSLTHLEHFRNMFAEVSHYLCIELWVVLIVTRLTNTDLEKNTNREREWDREREQENKKIIKIPQNHNTLT